jgi:hypothetical protein
MIGADHESKKIILPNPLRWAWRNPFKVVAIVGCLLVIVWNVENWRGKRDLIKLTLVRISGAKGDCFALTKVSATFF